MKQKRQKPEEAKQMRIGCVTITAVHPDMIRLYNEDTAQAVTLKAYDFADLLIEELNAR